MAATDLPPLPPLSFPARGAKKTASAAPVRKELTAQRKAVLDQMTPNNIGQVKMLHSSLFPVVYSERFYQEALWPQVRSINRIAYFNDLPVANIICRFEPTESVNVKLYIMTLGVLAPYRRLGLATKLLQNVLEQASPGTIVSLPVPQEPAPVDPKATEADKKNAKPPVTKDYKVESVYLNMQTSNVEARTFYERNGFSVTQELETYYQPGIEPRSAWILERK